MSHNTIRNRLRDAGIPRRDPIPVLELPIEKVISEYEEGHSLLEIAEKYQVHYTTVKNRLKKLGIEIRPKQKKSEIPLPVEQIHSEHLKGESLVSLAKKYRVSVTTIWRRLHPDAI